MSRQHAAPILVPVNGTAAPITVARPDWNEAFIQELIQAHPACLPIAEIDPLFADPVPLCRELNTAAGPIDNVFVTASGLPVLVECKLWSNPQARREVIGQIIDYAKELSRWTASDMQREVTRRTGRVGNAVLDLVREAGYDVDEIAFTDALTLNLRRGRFLLLIVGDGIREGVEAIAEYLQAHAGLHFTLSLVELPVYDLPDGSRLVAPRVLARTTTLTRTVVQVPDGFEVQPEGDTSAEDLTSRGASRPVATGSETELRRPETMLFWSEFLGDLHLDDPEQPVPKPSGAGHLRFSMPGPSGGVWVTVFRNKVENRLGIFLTHGRDPRAREVVDTVVRNGTARRSLADGAVSKLLGRDVQVWSDGEKTGLSCTCEFDDLSESVTRERAMQWLRERLNKWVNVLRPEIRAITQDLSKV